MLRKFYCYLPIAGQSFYSRRKITAPKNEVALSYRKVRGQYFLAAILQQLYILENCF